MGFLPTIVLTGKTCKSWESCKAFVKLNSTPCDSSNKITTELWYKRRLQSEKENHISHCRNINAERKPNNFNQSSLKKTLGLEQKKIYT